MYDPTWCEFCEDCVASETLSLVWADNELPVDDPALTKFIHDTDACFNCAQLYDRLEVAIIGVAGRLIRIKWDARPDGM